MFKVRRLTDSPYARLGVPRDGDLGYDLFVQEDVLLLPLIPRRIGNGVAVEPPEGYYFSLRPRSSTLDKFEMSLNSVEDPDQSQILYVQYGTVDRTYRGEVMTNVVNLGRKSCILKAGERISQLVLEQALVTPFEYTEELSVTERGSGGHGSTGR